MAAPGIDEALLEDIGKSFGMAAVERVRHWQQLVASSKALAEEEKLRIVNDFFNEFRFVEDKLNWGVDDYWATPLEFVLKRSGDCEDFAIAKYFMLIDLGVAEERLRMTYVKALKLHQSHMVLTYYSTPEAVPLVLDNLDLRVLPAIQRDDLVPVYSFNGKGLWLAKSMGSGKPLGGADRLGPWQKLMGRMRSVRSMADPGK